MREFTDSVGTAWRVWDTVPQLGAAHSEPLKKGWLTFQNTAGDRRRLAPIPPGWERADIDRLELMCRVADKVAPKGHTRDPDS